jgi:hypothetical protein
LRSIIRGWKRRHSDAELRSNSPPLVGQGGVISPYGGYGCPYKVEKKRKR